MSPREVFDTVDDAVHSVPRFTEARSLQQQAAQMGVSEEWLRKASDPSRKPKFPASMIVPLTIAAGNYAVVRTICELVGGKFVLLPRSNAHESDVIAALGEVLREVAEDAELIGRALSDNGRLDAHEVPDVLRNIDESLTRLATLREVVARRAK